MPDRLERLNAWETGPALDTEGVAPRDEPPPLQARATAIENRLVKLHASAHAAYASVDSGHEVGLDAALTVMEAELRALSDRSDARTKILKQVRLYARDAQSRELGKRELEACAEVLTGCQLGQGGLLERRGASQLNCVDSPRSGRAQQ